MPTSQKAEMDLVAFSETVETEKDRLLNSVREKATTHHMCSRKAACCCRKG